jgi:hypothetical protein
MRITISENKYRLLQKLDVARGEAFRDAKIAEVLARAAADKASHLQQNLADVLDFERIEAGAPVVDNIVFNVDPAGGFFIDFVEPLAQEG